MLLSLSLLPPRYKVTYSSNHNFLCYQRFFYLNFRIISKSILHNQSNSICKLNWQTWMRKYLLILFLFFMPFFFFWSWVVLLLFFKFLFTPFFFAFFLLELRCFSFSSLFGVGLFSFFFLVAVHDIEKPKIPKDLGKNITDDVVRGTCGCIAWNIKFDKGMMTLKECTDTEPNAHAYTLKHTDAHINSHIYVYAYVQTYTFIYTHKNPETHTHTHIYIYIYIYIYMHMQKHKNVNKHIHKYVFT